MQLIACSPERPPKTTATRGLRAGAASLSGFGRSPGASFVRSFVRATGETIPVVAVAEGVLGLPRDPPPAAGGPPVAPPPPAAAPAPGRPPPPRRSRRPAGRLSRPRAEPGLPASLRRCILT